MVTNGKLLRALKEDQDYRQSRLRQHLQGILLKAIKKKELMFNHQDTDRTHALLIRSKQKGRETEVSGAHRSDICIGCSYFPETQKFGNGICRLGNWWWEGAERCVGLREPAWEGAFADGRRVW